MYGFLSIAFGDVDTDKDGKITAPQFDRLCEKVAALPRRFGMAPSWQVEYTTKEDRIKARESMFAASTGGAEFMSMDQWVAFANGHVNGKIASIDYKKCDFNHLDKTSKDSFLEYITLAVEDHSSGAYASLYEFCLCLFVEADESCRGKIAFGEFDTLATKAAAVPRFYGLAPEGNCQDTRQAIFNNISGHEGHITFDAFLAWVIKHTKAHLKDPTARAVV